MSLSAQYEEELAEHLDGGLVNVRELDAPVLIVLEYSPRDDQRPISIAFDYSGGPKCWLSEPQMKKIRMEHGVDGPKRHDDYRKFDLDGRVFYPYSIQPFPQTIFENVEELVSACRSLYQHVENDGGY